MKVIAATGHRPTKLHLSGPYLEENHQKLVRFAEYTIKHLITKYGEFTAMSGMAQGWDQAWAEAALNLGLPLIAACACQNQDSVWHDHKVRVRYQDILNRASEIVVVHEGSYRSNPNCLQERNEYMVDNCDVLVALWDGSRGGTSNCIDYVDRAIKRQLSLPNPQPRYVIVENVWAYWDNFRR